MPEGVPGYLRIRVVNRSPLFYFTDGFELTGSGVTATLFHSLGTETGTDNSINYWTIDAGVPTFAAHVLSVPSGASIRAGHDDWGDCTALVRFIWTTGASPCLRIHNTATNNYIEATVAGGNLILQKNVAGTSTNVSSTAAALVNGNGYWFQVIASGTTYTATIFNDTSSAGTGSQGSTVATTNGTISDAGVQTGPMGLASTANTISFGGAFTNVCQVTGTPPDGTQGQAWTPVVTTGEPAFAASKNNPQAGTFSASIQIRGSSSGNGAWQQSIRLFAGTNGTLTAQAKASAGTANVSVGGLTTVNAGTAFGVVSATGAVTANPTVSCNYSGAVGTAYFDSLTYTDPAYEITNNLPHLHQSHVEVNAMQPGNPGSSALGSFTIPLFPPGSEQYAAAKPVYDQLDYFQRVECYISQDGKSLSKLYYGGVITGIRKGAGQNPIFELTGVSDMFWLNYSRPFAGEVLSTNYGSGSASTADYRQAHNYFGTNELGASDNFTPSFVSANYTSSNIPGLTAGSWTGTTDDGFDVVTVSTGTGAALISKTGAKGQDKRFINFVEAAGRLGNTSSTGQFGVGLSQSNLNCQTSTVAYVTISGTSFNVTKTDYLNGSQVATQTVTSALTSVQDPEGFFPVTVSLSVSGSSGGTNGTAVTVNGRVIMNTQTSPVVPTSYDASPATNYPFLFYGTNSGTDAAYFTYLVQEYRYTDDQNSGTALFKAGSIGSPTFSLQNGSDPGPTFLEVITRTATRESWYWRYTPQAYVVGTRTIGTIDFTTDPGTDRGTAQSIVFSGLTGNLLDLQLTANADQLAGGTTASSVSSNDGGGAAPWRDVSTLQKYGIVDDQVLAITRPYFYEQRRAAYQTIQRKLAINTSGSKTAIVLRDPQTVDVWRELDKVMIHYPDIGIFYLVTRVLSYTFDEGQTTQTITFDQYGVDDPNLPSVNFQQGVFQISLKFNNR